MTQLGELRRTWYLMEMNKGKRNVHQATKDRQRREFEDAVMALAQEIFEERRVTES